MTSTAGDARSLTRTDALGPLLSRVTGDGRCRQVEAELITGGKSNLTYLLRSPAGELILRRPPSGAVLATAHDMNREVRVQRALAHSAVPVPAIVLYDDGDLLGVPCYVMGKVDGLVLRGSALPASFAASGDERKALGHALADCLAELHAIDPAAVGLAGFGRPHGFVERQIRRWRAQWEASSDVPVPAVDALARQLAAHIPVSAAAAIAHGDYRIDNCIVDARDPGRLAAVLDWELSSLGDPLTDLGMFLFYWESGALVAPAIVSSIPGLPGFPSGTEIAQRWSDRTGLPLDDLDWYRAFAHFKFAVIMQGIRARVNSGAMGGQDFGDLTSAVADTAEAGLAWHRAWQSPPRAASTG
jgi:aminoglycoside phosphotransferase (APT) family kinase protein